MPRRPSAPLAFALLWLAACAGGEPQAASDPLLVISGPREFLRLELRGHGEEVLWRLVADWPTPLTELVYGEVPVGFRQEVPAGGAPPRPLADGEPLIMESLTPRRLFRHQGFAVHPQRFAIDHWEMRLREPAAPDADDEAATMDAAPGPA